ncbi:MAG: hypothetical protein RLO50_15895 [Azospirillaceae bacterium]
MAVLVPVSWGELLDKITILEIKAERIADPAKRRNVRTELDALTRVRDEGLAKTGVRLIAEADGQAGAETGAREGAGSGAQPGVQAAPDHPSRVADLVAGLKRVNETLWDTEDAIRACEARQDFGPTFIALARRVYVTNDDRAAKKRELNDLLGSELVEEKSYEAYGVGG